MSHLKHVTRAHRSTSHNHARTAASTIESEVRRLIAERFGLAEAMLADDMSLVDDLGADSLAEVELVIALEQRFGVDIHDEEAAHVRTVGDVVHHVADAIRYQ